MRTRSWFVVLVMAACLVAAAGLLPLAGAADSSDSASEEGWVTLFDGKSLDGWEANENPETFSVANGELVVHGKRSHLFYIGQVENHDFKNFDFKAEVMTKPSSNSGIYFHTKFQPTGWPDAGYEVQVNNTHRDPKKTGGLYDVKDVFEQHAKDEVWFTEEIVVRGKHVEVKIDGKTVVDFTEPDDFEVKNHPGRKVGHGTFALQGHDPVSEVHFRNIRVKVLPDAS